MNPTLLVLAAISIAVTLSSAAEWSRAAFDDRLIMTAGTLAAWGLTILIGSGAFQ